MRQHYDIGAYVSLLLLPLILFVSLTKAGPIRTPSISSALVDSAYHQWESPSSSSPQTTDYSTLEGTPLFFWKRLLVKRSPDNQWDGVSALTHEEFNALDDGWRAAYTGRMRELESAPYAPAPEVQRPSWGLVMSGNFDGPSDIPVPQPQDQGLFAGPLDPSFPTYDPSVSSISSYEAPPPGWFARMWQAMKNLGRRFSQGIGHYWQKFKNLCYSAYQKGGKVWDKFLTSTGLRKKPPGEGDAPIVPGGLTQGQLEGTEPLGPREEGEEPLVPGALRKVDGLEELPPIPMDTIENKAGEFLQSESAPLELNALQGGGHPHISILPPSPSSPGRIPNSERHPSVDAAIEAGEPGNFDFSHTDGKPLTDDQARDIAKQVAVGILRTKPEAERKALEKELGFSLEDAIRDADKRKEREAAKFAAMAPAEWEAEEAADRIRVEQDEEKKKKEDALRAAEAEAEKKAQERKLRDAEARSDRNAVHPKPTKDPEGKKVIMTMTPIPGENDEGLDAEAQLPMHPKSEEAKRKKAAERNEQLTADKASQVGPKEVGETDRRAREAYDISREKTVAADEAKSRADAVQTRLDAKQRQEMAGPVQVENAVGTLTKDIHPPAPVERKQADTKQEQIDEERRELSKQHWRYGMQLQKDIDRAKASYNQISNPAERERVWREVRDMTYNMNRNKIYAEHLLALADGDFEKVRNTAVGQRRLEDIYQNMLKEDKLNQELPRNVAAKSRADSKGVPFRPGLKKTDSLLQDDQYDSDVKELTYSSITKKINSMEEEDRQESAKRAAAEASFEAHVKSVYGASPPKLTLSIPFSSPTQPTQPVTYHNVGEERSKGRERWERSSEAQRTDGYVPTMVQEPPSGIPNFDGAFQNMMGAILPKAWQVTRTAMGPAYTDYEARLPSVGSALFEEANPLLGYGEHVSDKIQHRKFPKTARPPKDPNDSDSGSADSEYEPVFQPDLMYNPDASAAVRPDEPPYQTYIHQVEELRALGFPDPRLIPTVPPSPPISEPAPPPEPTTTQKDVSGMMVDWGTQTDFEEVKFEHLLYPNAIRGGDLDPYGTTGTPRYRRTTLTMTWPAASERTKSVPRPISTGNTWTNPQWNGDRGVIQNFAAWIGKPNWAPVPPPDTRFEYHRLPPKSTIHTRTSFEPVGHLPKYSSGKTIPWLPTTSSTLDYHYTLKDGEEVWGMRPIYDRDSYLSFIATHTTEPKTKATYVQATVTTDYPQASTTIFEGMPQLELLRMSAAAQSQGGWAPSRPNPDKLALYVHDPILVAHLLPPIPTSLPVIVTTSTRKSHIHPHRMTKYKEPTSHWVSPVPDTTLYSYSLQYHALPGKSYSIETVSKSVLPPKTVVAGPESTSAPKGMFGLGHIHLFDHLKPTAGKHQKDGSVFGTDGAESDEDPKEKSSVALRPTTATEAFNVDQTLVDTIPPSLVKSKHVPASITNEPPTRVVADDWMATSLYNWVDTVSWPASNKAYLAQTDEHGIHPTYTWPQPPTADVEPLTADVTVSAPSRFVYTNFFSDNPKTWSTAFHYRRPEHEVAPEVSSMRSVIFNEVPAATRGDLFAVRAAGFFETSPELIIPRPGSPRKLSISSFHSHKPRYSTIYPFPFPPAEHPYAFPEGREEIYVPPKSTKNMSTFFNFEWRDPYRNFWYRTHSTVIPNDLPSRDPRVGYYRGPITIPDDWRAALPTTTDSEGHMYPHIYSANNVYEDIQEELVGEPIWPPWSVSRAAHSASSRRKFGYLEPPIQTSTIPYFRRKKYNPMKKYQMTKPPKPRSTLIRPGQEYWPVMSKNAEGEMIMVDRLEMKPEDFKSSVLARDATNYMYLPASRISALQSEWDISSRARASIKSKFDRYNDWAGVGHIWNFPPYDPDPWEDKYDNLDYEHSYLYWWDKTAGSAEQGEWVYQINTIRDMNWFERIFLGDYDFDGAADERKEPAKVEAVLTTDSGDYVSRLTMTVPTSTSTTPPWSLKRPTRSMYEQRQRQRESLERWTDWRRGGQGRYSPPVPVPRKSKSRAISVESRRRVITTSTEKKASYDEASFKLATGMARSLSTTTARKEEMDTAGRFELEANPVRDASMTVPTVEARPTEASSRRWTLPSDPLPSDKLEELRQSLFKQGPLPSLRPMRTHPYSHKGPFETLVFTPATELVSYNLDQGIDPITQALSYKDQGVDPITQTVSYADWGVQPTMKVVSYRDQGVDPIVPMVSYRDRGVQASLLPPSSDAPFIPRAIQYQDAGIQVDIDGPMLAQPTMTGPPHPVLQNRPVNAAQAAYIEPYLIDIQGLEDSRKQAKAARTEIRKLQNLGPDYKEKVDKEYLASLERKYAEQTDRHNAQLRVMGNKMNGRLSELKRLNKQQELDEVQRYEMEKLLVLLEKVDLELAQSDDKWRQKYLQRFVDRQEVEVRAPSLDQLKDAAAHWQLDGVQPDEQLPEQPRIDAATNYWQLDGNCDSKPSAECDSLRSPPKRGFLETLLEPAVNFFKFLGERQDWQLEEKRKKQLTDEIESGSMSSFEAGSLSDGADEPGPIEEGIEIERFDPDHRSSMLSHIPFGMLRNMESGQKMTMTSANSDPSGEPVVSHLQVPGMDNYDARSDVTWHSGSGGDCEHCRPHDANAHSNCGGCLGWEPILLENIETKTAQDPLETAVVMVGALPVGFEDSQSEGESLLQRYVNKGQNGLLVNGKDSEGKPRDPSAEEDASKHYTENWIMKLDKNAPGEADVEELSSPLDGYNQVAPPPTPQDVDAVHNSYTGPHQLNLGVLDYFHKKRKKFGGSDYGGTDGASSDPKHAEQSDNERVNAASSKISPTITFEDTDASKTSRPYDGPLAPTLSSSPEPMVGDWPELQRTKLQRAPLRTDPSEPIRRDFAVDLQQRPALFVPSEAMPRGWPESPSSKVQEAPLITSPSESMPGDFPERRHTKAQRTSPKFNPKPAPKKAPNIALVQQDLDKAKASYQALLAGKKMNGGFTEKVEGLTAEEQEQIWFEEARAASKVMDAETALERAIEMKKEHDAYTRTAADPYYLSRFAGTRVPWPKAGSIPSTSNSIVKQSTVDGSWKRRVRFNTFDNIPKPGATEAVPVTSTSQVPLVQTLHNGPTRVNSVSFVAQIPVGELLQDSKGRVRPTVSPPPSLHSMSFEAFETLADIPGWYISVSRPSRDATIQVEPAISTSQTSAAQPSKDAVGSVLTAPSFPIRQLSHYVAIGEMPEISPSQISAAQPSIRRLSDAVVNRPIPAISGPATVPVVSLLPSLNVDMGTPQGGFPKSLQSALPTQNVEKTQPTLVLRTSQQKKPTAAAVAPRIPNVMVPAMEISRQNIRTTSVSLDENARSHANFRLTTTGSAVTQGASGIPITSTHWWDTMPTNDLFWGTMRRSFPGDIGKIPDLPTSTRINPTAQSSFQQGPPGQTYASKVQQPRKSVPKERKGQQGLVDDALSRIGTVTITDGDRTMTWSYSPHHHGSSVEGAKYSTSWHMEPQANARSRKSKHTAAVALAQAIPLRPGEGALSHTYRDHSLTETYTLRAAPTHVAVAAQKELLTGPSNDAVVDSLTEIPPVPIQSALELDLSDVIEIPLPEHWTIAGLRSGGVVRAEPTVPVKSIQKGKSVRSVLTVAAEPSIETLIVSGGKPQTTTTRPSKSGWKKIVPNFLLPKKYTSPITSTFIAKTEVESIALPTSTTFPDARQALAAAVLNPRSNAQNAQPMSDTTETSDAPAGGLGMVLIAEPEHRILKTVTWSHPPTTVSSNPAWPKSAALTGHPSNHYPGNAPPAYLRAIEEDFDYTSEFIRGYSTRGIPFPMMTLGLENMFDANGNLKKNQPPRYAVGTSKDGLRPRGPPVQVINNQHGRYDGEWRNRPDSQYPCPECFGTPRNPNTGQPIPGPGVPVPGVPDLRNPHNMEFPDRPINENEFRQLVELGFCPTCHLPALTKPQWEERMEEYLPGECRVCGLRVKRREEHWDPDYIPPCGHDPKKPYGYYINQDRKKYPIPLLGWTVSWDPIFKGPAEKDPLRNYGRGLVVHNADGHAISADWLKQILENTADGRYFNDQLSKIGLRIMPEHGPYADDLFYIKPETRGQAYAGYAGGNPPRLDHLELGGLELGKAAEGDLGTGQAGHRHILNKDEYIAELIDGRAQEIHTSKKPYQTNMAEAWIVDHFTDPFQIFTEPPGPTVTTHIHNWAADGDWPSPNKDLPVMPDSYTPWDALVALNGAYNSTARTLQELVDVLLPVENDFEHEAGPKPHYHFSRPKYKTTRKKHTTEGELVKRGFIPTPPTKLVSVWTTASAGETTAASTNFPVTTVRVKSSITRGISIGPKYRTVTTETSPLETPLAMVKRGLASGDNGKDTTEQHKHYYTHSCHIGHPHNRHHHAYNKAPEVHVHFHGIPNNYIPVFGMPVEYDPSHSSDAPHYEGLGQTGEIHDPFNKQFKMPVPIGKPKDTVINIKAYYVQPDSSGSDSESGSEWWDSSNSSEGSDESDEEMVKPVDKNIPSTSTTYTVALTTIRKIKSGESATATMGSVVTSNEFGTTSFETAMPTESSSSVEISHPTETAISVVKVGPVNLKEVDVVGEGPSVHEHYNGENSVTANETLKIVHEVKKEEHKSDDATLSETQLHEHSENPSSEDSKMEQKQGNDTQSEGSFVKYPLPTEMPESRETSEEQPRSTTEDHKSTDYQPGRKHHEGHPKASFEEHKMEPTSVRKNEHATGHSDSNHHKQKTAETMHSDHHSEHSVDDHENMAAESHRYLTAHINHNEYHEPLEQNKDAHPKIAFHHSIQHSEHQVIPYHEKTSMILEHDHEKAPAIIYQIPHHGKTPVMERPYVSTYSFNKLSPPDYSTSDSSTSESSSDYSDYTTSDSESNSSWLDTATGSSSSDSSWLDTASSDSSSTDPSSSGWSTDSEESSESEYSDGEDYNSWSHIKSDSDGEGRVNGGNRNFERHEDGHRAGNHGGGNGVGGYGRIRVDGRGEGDHRHGGHGRRV